MEEVKMNHTKCPKNCLPIKNGTKIIKFVVFADRYAERDIKRKIAYKLQKINCQKNGKTVSHITFPLVNNVKEHSYTRSEFIQEYNLQIELDKFVQRKKEGTRGLLNSQASLDLLYRLIFLGFNQLEVSKFLNISQQRLTYYLRPEFYAFKYKGEWLIRSAQISVLDNGDIREKNLKIEYKKSGRNNDFSETRLIRIRKDRLIKTLNHGESSKQSFLEYQPNNFLQSQIIELLNNDSKTTKTIISLLKKSINKKE